MKGIWLVPLLLCLLPLHSIGIGSLHLVIYFFSGCAVLFFVRDEAKISLIIAYFLFQAIFVATLLLNETSVFSNALFLYLQFLMFFACCQVKKLKIMRFTLFFERYVSWLIILSLLLFVLFGSTNTDAEISRGKFLGSTSYIASLGGLMAVYLMLAQKGRLHRSQTGFFWWFQMVVSCTPALLAGVRGNILHVIVAFVLTRTRKRGIEVRNRSLVSILFSVLILGAAYNLGLFETTFKRFSIGADEIGFRNIMIVASSGRFLSWEYIYEMLSQGGNLKVLAGFGLGAVETLPANDLQYPHLDLLFILLELGGAGAFLYLACLFLLCRQYGLLPVVLVFFNSLHTNFAFFIGLHIFVVLFKGRQLLSESRLS